MKKTISLLLAVAGIAVGSELKWDADAKQYVFGVNDWSAEPTADYYSITLSEKFDLSQENWEFSLTTTINPSVGFNQWGTALFCTGDNPFPSGTHEKGFQMYSTVAGGVNIKGSGMTNSNGTTLLAANSLSAGTYTFSIIRDGAETTFGVQDATGKSLGTYVSKGTWEGVTVGKIVTTLTENQLGTDGGWTYPTGYFRIVPEPATATLSLLALCGLAARRRRL